MFRFRDRLVELGDVAGPLARLTVQDRPPSTDL
jgi:hypothetical protein